MVTRKKTKLENLFNFNRYKKRRGAKAYQKQLDQPDYEQLKNNIISGHPPTNFQSYMIKDLNEHMAHLKTAFIGKPEILYYHAQLIVLLRRESHVEENFIIFKNLWRDESAFLCQHLNMRWLIAAADTFIDYETDSTVSALLLNAVVLVNTIKLYETEYHLFDINSKNIKNYNLSRLEEVGENCFDLFDELPSFRIGVDDTLRNMRWRLETISKPHPVAHQLLFEIFNRVNTNDNVYKRFRDCHKKPRTAWWDN